MIIAGTTISIEIQPSGERRLTVQGIIGLSVNLSRENLQKLLDELSLSLIPTPYEILGVSPQASDEDISRAYRTRAKELHPDVGSGGHAAMQDLNAAYETLSDSTRRDQFNQRR